jgi:hypothetical protein
MIDVRGGVPGQTEPSTTSRVKDEVVDRGDHRVRPLDVQELV